MVQKSLLHRLLFIQKENNYFVLLKLDTYLASKLRCDNVIFCSVLGQTDGWMDGWLDECVSVCVVFLNHTFPLLFPSFETSTPINNPINSENQGGEGNRVGATWWVWTTPIRNKYTFALDKQDPAGNPTGSAKMLKGGFSLQKNIKYTLNTRCKWDDVFFIKRTSEG